MSEDSQCIFKELEAEEEKDPTEEPQPVLSPEQQMKAELHAYEAMPKLDPEEDSLYWKVQSPRFPGLHKLAQS